jgi:phosphoglycerate dehydrogenase-like enzyme
LVDAALLAHARPSAHLINIARGTVVDQDALIATLDAGRLAFATLEVTDPEPLPAGHPLWTHPRIRLTPHISTNYAACRAGHLAKILDSFDLFARGQVPTDLVDPATGY